MTVTKVKVSSVTISSIEGGHLPGGRHGRVPHQVVGDHQHRGSPARDVQVGQVQGRALAHPTSPRGHSVSTYKLRMFKF